MATGSPAVEAAAPIPKRHRRYRFRFGLRTFFLVFTLLTVVFGGWLAYERNRCERGQAALRKLEEQKMGAIAELAYIWLRFENPPRIILSRDPKWEPRPDWLRDILGDNSFEAVCEVHLMGPYANEEILGLVSQLSGTKKVSISRGQIPDAGLRKLTSLQRLESLSLSGDGTDEQIAWFARLPHLKELRLRYSEVSGTGLRHFHQIEELHVEYNPLTDAGLSSLSPDSRLKRIFLYRTKVTGSGLAGFTQLEKLEINACPLTDEGLASVCQNKNLRALSIGFAEISDDSLASIATLPNLTDLEIRDARFTDEGLTHLGRMSQLETLTLATYGPLSEAGPHGPITDTGLEQLAGLTRLKTLRIESESAITDEGLKSLRDMAQLEWLTLYSSRITDAGLQSLQQNTKLETLHLRDARITKAGAAKLRESVPFVRIRR